MIGGPVQVKMHGFRMGLLVESGQPRFDVTFDRPTTRAELSLVAEELVFSYFLFYSLFLCINLISFCVKKVFLSNIWLTFIYD